MKSVLPCRTPREWLAGHNQRDVARKMGVNHTIVHRLYIGKTRRPSARTIMALAKVLKIHPTQILLDTDNSTSAAGGTVSDNA